MPEKVYFTGVRAREPGQNTISKIQRLFDAAGFPRMIEPGDLTAIKLHFGEWGNESYISPVHVRQVVDRVKDAGGKPFLTDSNTLYRGMRSNAVDHLCTAVEHGFAYAVVGAPLIIADGLCGGNWRSVDINSRHFPAVRVSGDIADSQAMIVLSHFKGHDVAGFGGAIKNLAMGCAPPAGKQAQHCARPLNLEEKCTGCGKCVAVCPGEAISVVETGNAKIARIEHARCVGCFECMSTCPSNAIDVDWETEIPEFIERMVEYAFGVVKGRQKKTGYMNFLLRITPDCDCVPWSDVSIVPDIGILASRDPVAIDAASYDLVNAQEGNRGSFLQKNHGKGKDKFRGTWKNTNGYRQIQYGEEIFLGQSSYDLISID
jgi:uncharacterized Fe-S center protein